MDSEMYWVFYAEASIKTYSAVFGQDKGNLKQSLVNATNQLLHCT